MKWAAVPLILAAVVGCTREPFAREDIVEGRAVGLVSLPQQELALCRKSPLLRPACPRRVPATRYRYLSHLARGGPPALHVFDLQRGGEDPRRPGRARPPAVAHVTVVAGNVEGLAPFLGRPLGDPVELRAGLMRMARTEPVSFGRVNWGDRVGFLFLAPPYLHGGQLGNHVCFRWRDREQDVVVSLHGWEPLPDAVATLRAMVESTHARSR